MIEIRVSCLKAMVVLKRDPYFQRLVALGQGNGNSIGLARDYRINYKVMHESPYLVLPARFIYYRYDGIPEC